MPAEDDASKPVDDTPQYEDDPTKLSSGFIKARDQGADGAISYNYIEIGLVTLKISLTFRYKDFKLEKHDDARLNGIVTKEQTRGGKHWITSEIIGRMVKAMLQDGIQNGTLSWDVLIMKTVSLQLHSITGARADDVRRSRLYEGVECLR
ncbi:hypothetical protein ACHAPJ_005893 [Fusarium lateritium]